MGTAVKKIFKQRERRRVVVTGIGVVSSLGLTNQEFQARLLKGESNAGEITVFDPASFSTRIAAQAPREELDYDSPDRKVAFGVCAARRAMEDTDRETTPIKDFYRASGGRPPVRSGLQFGMGLELFSLPDMVAYIRKELAGELPESFDISNLQTPSDICLHIIAREWGINTAPGTHVSACAAATDAIGAAFRLIREGRRDWILAGGADSMINPLGLGGFCLLQAMTTRNEDPARASRPFDRDRDGFLLGEGAAALVLEEREAARSRGARIYGEIVGYGNSFDAHGISEPHPEAEGATIALRRALADAGLSGEEVGYINAHGTSTPKNDPVEAKALRNVFGKHTDKLQVSSTKSMLGHCISAAGALESAALLLCGSSGLAHPSMNLKNQDPRIELDIIQDRPAALTSPYIMKNSFAFGGQNTGLIFKVADLQD